MNARPIVVGILLSTTLALPGAVGAADTDGCEIRTSPAFQVAETVYLAGATVRGTSVYANVWIEENGVAGLQMYESRCQDGRTIPSDICLSAYDHTLAGCALMSTTQVASHTGLLA